MNKVKYKILRIVCVFIIFWGGVVALSLTHKIFIPKWTERNWNAQNIVEGFYDEEKDSIDVLFLGASQFMSGVTPMEIYEDYGISSYSLALNEQLMMLSYHWLIEACKYQELKVVVLEVQMLYQDSEEFRYRQNLDYMKFSHNKLQAIIDLNEMDSEQRLIDYIFPILYYHNRWDELGKEDFTKSMQIHYFNKGFTFKPAVKQIDYKGILCDDSHEVEAIADDKLKWLNRIIEYCEDNHINIVLVKTPRPDWSAGRHNAVKEFADSNNISFLDFNELSLYQRAGFDNTKDFLDSIHLNIHGAQKLSAFMGDYLNSRYSLDDHRNDEEYALWDDDLATYKRELWNSELQVCTDIYEYLERIHGKDGYAILIAAKDDYTTALDDTLKTQLILLGATKANLNTYRASYIVIVNDGKMVYEQCDSNSEIEYTGNIENVPYYVSSGGYTCGNYASIIFDGTENSKNGRGLNIVIYDKVREKVIDSVCFDTFKGLTCKR